MTKAQAALYSTYQQATTTDLSQVYGRYSYAKEQAMHYCHRLQAELNGYDGRICSANTFQFSYAFRYTDVDGQECLCYITKAHDRRFPLV